MHELSVTLFGLVLALFLIQIRQQHVEDVTHPKINSEKNNAGKMDSNVTSAMDFIERFWLIPRNRNIRRLRKNLLIMFTNGSTKRFEVQKNIQFYQQKSVATGKKVIKTIISKELLQKPRNRRRRSLFNGVGSDELETQKSLNHTLSCHGELSCRNRCFHPRKVLYQAQLSCFCDEDCELFEDCCADYDDFCGTNGQNVTNGTIQSTTTTENLVTQENSDLWKCYEGEKFEGTLGIWMIGSCPSSWPEDDVLYRCRNLSETNKITKDNYWYLPVYTSNGRVYHNRFCAQCNGVSAKDMSSFILSIQCGFSPPQHLSLQDKIQFLFMYCSEKIKWKASGGHPRRYCITFAKTGKESGPSEGISNPEQQIKCTQGKPRVVSTGQKIYKNVECAKYIGDMKYLSCGPNISTSSNNDWNEESGSTDLPKPLSLIFDFNPKSNSLYLHKTQCEDNKVYDHYLEICREGISPGLPTSASHLSEYQVALWVFSPKEFSKCLKGALANYFLARTLGISQQKVKNLTVQSYEKPSKSKFQFNLKITQIDGSLSSIRRILDFKLPFNISIIGQLFPIVKATSRILSCSNRQKYDRSEYTVLQDGSSAVFIKKTGEVFEAKDYYINTTEAKTSANDSQAIFVCRQHQISNCSGVYILINEGGFRVLINKSILVNASKQVYDWSEYKWINKSVLVCENFSTTYYKSKVVSNDDPVLTTLTIVCMSLSIIGLVFVLVTYSLFSELRTPPGINLMNLSVSILLAQLLWLLGSGRTDTSMTCTVIAVILHYLFLVCFMWTSIIAFDTWRAFSAKGRPLANTKAQRMKQHLYVMAVGWLPVMVYVSICVALDSTDTVNIGYKSRITCWMANKWAILYFFAVPVFMLLVLNMVLYVLTFRAIKVTTAQARTASDRNNRNTSCKFGIYVRIASLMGFTWIFGFAAPFAWQFLWYPFVILNGLQGAYIALAFPLSKRARSLYKEWLTGKPSQETTARSATSKAKAQDAKYSKKCSDTKF